MSSIPGLKYFCNLQRSSHNTIKMNRMYGVASRNMRNSCRLQQFCTAGNKAKAAPKTDKPAAPLVKNYATAVLLLAFVAGVYYTSIAKMRQTDDLTKLIDEEEEHLNKKK